MSRVNLVAILLTLSCLARALENSRSTQEEKREGHRGGYPVGRRILRETSNKIASQNLPLLRGEDKAKVAKVQAQDDSLALSKSYLEERDHPRGWKRKMDRMTTALLMAYKMKFIALIPTLIGGLILLKGTTLLAGFFFALFAAVLGLKVH